MNDQMTSQHEKKEQKLKDEIKNLNKSTKSELINLKEQLKLKDLQIENVESSAKLHKRDSNLGNMINDENYELDQIKTNMDAKVHEYTFIVLLLNYLLSVLSFSI